MSQINQPKTFKYTKKNKSNIKVEDMDILEFTEQVNIKNARKILSLSNETIINEIYDSSETNQHGIKYTATERDDYIKQVKQFCKLAIANEGVIKQGYKYANAFKDRKCGRIYVNRFGIQSLQSKLRGFLGGEYSHDIDIINAAPSILVYFVDKYYPDLDIPNLKKYIIKRDKLLAKHDTTKIEVLKWLNRDHTYNGQNVLLKCLDRDFKIIQNAIYGDKNNEICSLIDLNEIKSTNKKGSFINRVCCIIENTILQKVIGVYGDKISVPYFDGAWFDKSLTPSEIIEKCNSITEEYGIKWSHKEHISLDVEDIDDDIELDDNDDKKEEQLYGYDYITYEDLKAKFEKNHAIIQIPYMIVKEYEDVYEYENNEKKTMTYELYNDATLKALYNNLYFQKKLISVDKKTGKMTEEIVDEPFMKHWLTDRYRRTLKKVDFIPYSIDDSKIPKNIYNSFTGFDATLPKEDKNVDKEIKLFLDHLKLLVNYEDDSYNYLVNYIADMMQNPKTLPETALLFKSKQGLGKDLLINYLEKIIGERYTYRTSNLEEIYGSFNPAVKNKLLVQLNELEGKDGFARKERLKDSITALKLNINEKNLKQFQIRNCIRFFIFSNNITPIDIPVDDRRFVVFQGADLLPKAERVDYYNPLFDNINNNDVINGLFKYFMNVDIRDFNIRQQRPITSAYKEMRETNTPPIYKYLNEIANNNLHSNSIHYISKFNKYAIKTTDFHSNFQQWFNKVIKGEINLNFKLIKPQLNEINITPQRISIGGNQSAYYVYDKDNLIEVLASNYHMSDDDSDVWMLDDDSDM